MNTETYNTLPVDVKAESNIIIDENLPTGIVMKSILSADFIKEIRAEKKRRRQNVRVNRHPR